jgi:acetoin utilization deacetylase AcuC-like enzyme
MPLVIVSSARFAEHGTPPGHPDRVERAEIMDVVAEHWRRQGGEVVAPRLAGDDQLLRAHDPDYVRRISGLSGQSHALDHDTYTSPESPEIARLACGAAIDAVERAMAGRHVRTLALVRPPGHHAERDRAMGFCLYNNIAVAAAHARASGLDRVAIVDYDVHHGNGTQHLFDRDPDVLYISLHQFPYYPGTGAAGEVGSDEGLGFTVNIPLAAGSTGDDYRLALAELAVPVLRQFRPELLLVSAGFDAHERDPLGGMRLTTGEFAAMTRELRAVADECCDGRLAAIVEGGYDGRALAGCLEAVVEVLAEEESAPPAWPGSGHGQQARGRAAVAAARTAHLPFWGL